MVLALQVVELNWEEHGFAAGLQRERLAVVGKGVPVMRYADGLYCIVAFH